MTCCSLVILRPRSLLKMRMHTRCMQNLLSGARTPPRIRLLVLLACPTVWPPRPRDSHTERPFRLLGCPTGGFLSSGTAIVAEDEDAHKVCAEFAEWCEDTSKDPTVGAPGLSDCVATSAPGLSHCFYVRLIVLEQIPRFRKPTRGGAPGLRNDGGLASFAAQINTPSRVSIPRSVGR